MGRRSRIFIVVAILVAGIAIGGAVIYALAGRGGNDYYSYISRGQQYMASEDYDRAIEAFSIALKIDETKTEAYTCLAQAYNSSGSTEMAKTVLNRGIAETGSLTLSLMMQDVFGEYVSTTMEGNADLTVEKHTTESTCSLNRNMLDFISSAAFGDYNQKYGIASTSVNGNVYSYTIDKLGVTVTYTNGGSVNKIDANTGLPYREYMPDSIKINNLALLFGVSSVSYEELKHLDGISNLTREDDTITFSCEGCEVTISLTDDCVKSESWNTIYVEQVELEEEQESSILRGKVIDVANGSGIANVHIKAYAGYSASGTPVETTTDSAGNYSMNLPSGNNYIVVSKDGYISASYTVYVTSGGETSENFELSSELQDGEMRLVLTWGGNPADLDSHLIGTTDSGNYVHTFYSNKSAYNSNGQKLAELDLDDTDAYGPETTTIYELNGYYEFYVHDFSCSGIMSNSGAQVKIYRGNALVQTIDICSGCGLYWSVVTIDHGNVTVTNRPRS